MSQEDTLKQRIRAGETIVALRPPVTYSRAQLEDALRKGNYDLVYVDGQHTPFSDDGLVAFCSMVAELGLPVQFRIPHTREAHLVGRYLDMGPGAILVPEVESIETVDDAIDYFYYPQQGRRSWGGSARYGLSAGDGTLDRLTYAEWWNTNGVLAIQLESVDAITNARQLARAGVDYVAFGPNDLAFSLEGHPEYPLQTVEACMRNVAAQLSGTGIRLGMAVTSDPEERELFLEMGVTVFQESPRQ